MTVSYTHLDVYKRQGIYLPLFFGLYQNDLKIRLTEFPHHLTADPAGGTVILYYSL